MSWPFSSSPPTFSNVPVRTGKLTKLAPHNIRVARSGSVLNATRKQAAVNRLKSSYEYTEALRAGLSNNNAMNYVHKLEQWYASKPRRYRGQHQNNAIAESNAWELTHPRPHLPGQFRPQGVLSYPEDNFNRRYAENHGRARKSRKSRKSRH